MFKNLKIVVTAIGVARVGELKTEINNLVTDKRRSCLEQLSPA